MRLQDLYQFSQCQQGMDMNQRPWRCCREWGGRLGFGFVRDRGNPGLGNADRANLGVTDEVTRGTTAPRTDGSFNGCRLSRQRMIWMYNPHNPRGVYRYRGFIYALSPSIW